MKGKLILSVAEAADREKWAEVRKQGIGGSDIAVITGNNPWKSAYKLWAEKTGRIEEDDLSDNEYVYWGTVLEQAVADRFCELADKKVRKCGTLADEEYPFLHANIDRWVVGENAGLECKTANSFKGNEWKDDQLPDAYYLQCQFYMMVTGADRWYIAVLIGGNHFVWKEIERNDNIIADIRTAAVEFWTKNVEGNVPPELDGSESTSEIIDKEYPASNGFAVALPSTVQALLAEYDQQKSLESMITERKKAIENAIKALMGDNEVGTYQDRKVSWKTQAGRVTIDSQKLQNEYPDAYAACMKVGKPSRRFSVK